MNRKDTHVAKRDFSRILPLTDGDREALMKLVHERMAERGLNLVQMADRAGVPPGFMAQWRRDRSVRAATLARVLGVLEIDPAIVPGAPPAMDPADIARIATAVREDRKAGNRTFRKPETAGPKWHNGERTREMLKEGMRLARAGVTRGKVRAALMSLNNMRCSVRLRPVAISRIVEASFRAVHPVRPYGEVKPPVAEKRPVVQKAAPTAASTESTAETVETSFLTSKFVWFRKVVERDDVSADLAEIAGETHDQMHGLVEAAMADLRATVGALAREGASVGVVRTTLAAWNARVETARKLTFVATATSTAPTGGAK